MTHRYPVPAALKKAAAHIRKTNPNEVFGISPDRWKEQFPRDADVQRLANKFHNGISRASVVKCAPKAKNPTFQQLRPLFIATMMWGYGDAGFAQWRTDQMLRDPAIKKALPCACRHALNGDPQAAAICCPIKWCGMSYFTKFLYFAGKAYKIRPMPLILDTYVLDELYRCNRALAKKIASHKKGGDGFVSEFRAYKGGYALYVEEMNRWARDIKVKPDQLEYFLFDTNRKRRS